MFSPESTQQAVAGRLSWRATGDGARSKRGAPGDAVEISAGARDLLATDAMAAFSSVLLLESLHRSRVSL